MIRAAPALPVLLAVCACVVSHVRKEIPPPGGCDQCHRWKIAGNWEVAVAPAPLGKDGGALSGSDLVLRGIQSLPYHGRVPAKRLAVYAVAAPEDTVGDAEAGIQCFVCHRSPSPPHESFRGKIPHPWGQRKDQP